MSKQRTPLTRRRFLGRSAAAGALAAALRTAFPAGAWAASGDAPEVGGAILGFIALTDAAPLIVARELSLFADEGLNVTLRR